MDIKAFFISPDNKIIDVSTKHISKIIDEPEIFGLNLINIKKTFNKYNEPLRFEGYARDEIISDLLKNNWVRVRIRKEKQIGNVLVFQINELNEISLNQIKEFSHKIIKGINDFKLSENILVKILDINGFIVSDKWLTIKNVIKTTKFN